MATQKKKKKKKHTHSHSEKAEWINNMTRELEGLEEGRKRKYRSIYQNYTKKISTGKRQAIMEYMVSGSRIHLYSRQTSSRNEQMPTRSTRTRMDDQRKDHIDLKDAIKETASNNYKPITCLPMMWKILIAQIRKRLQLANKPRIVLQGAERVLQRIQRHSRVTLHKSTHPK